MFLEMDASFDRIALTVLEVPSGLVGAWTLLWWAIDSIITLEHDIRLLG